MRLRQSSTTSAEAPCSHIRYQGRAFTLIELLVTLSLIALLIAILIPSLRAVRRQSRALKCQLNLRNVAFEFQAFLTPAVPMDRGHDEIDPTLTGGRIYLETFQESQYRIDEFWGYPDSRYQTDANELGVMNCPEVAGTIQLKSDQTCRNGAVTPPAIISYAFNLRLDRAEIKIGEMWSTRQARLNESLLSQQLIPIIWDINGRTAEQKRITPHFSAPPGEPGKPYTTTDVWFPASDRHNNLQVAFNSGEVLTSKTPLAESSWGWTFNP